MIVHSFIYYRMNDLPQRDELIQARKEIETLNNNLCKNTTKYNKQNKTKQNKTNQTKQNKPEHHRLMLVHLLGVATQLAMMKMTHCCHDCCCCCCGCGCCCSCCCVVVVGIGTIFSLFWTTRHIVKELDSGVAFLHVREDTSNTFSPRAHDEIDEFGLEFNSSHRVAQSLLKD